MELAEMQTTKQDLRFEEMIKKIQSGTMRMSEKDALSIAGQLYTRGRYKQAETVCRQLIEHKPSAADAHSILGVSLNAQGKAKEGIKSLKTAIKLNPKIASYRSNLGEVYRQAGNQADAIVALLGAIDLDPKNAQAYNNLGIVRFEGQQIDLAIDAYKKAIELNPDFPEAHNNLGNALRIQGDLDGAVEAYQTALSLKARYPEAYNNLGTLLRDQGKAQQAMHALKKAIQQNPKYLDAYNNLAALYFAEKNDVEALRQLTEALKIGPQDPRTLILTARVQNRRGNYPAAEKACRIALQGEPSNAEALTVLGTIMHELDRYEEALEYLEKAVQLSPKSAEARNYYGVALKSVGRLEEAKEQLLAGLSFNSNMFGAYANLNDLVDFSKEKELFEKIEAIMESADDPKRDIFLPLHFAYAKALDDNKQHEKALEHYITGGQLKRKHLNYNESETEEFFTNIKKAFPPSIFKTRPFEGMPDERPLFIVGMPRSGSTLVEQIISSHKDIHGAGEVKYFSQALNRMRDRFPAISRYPELVKELKDKQYHILADDYLNSLIKSAGNAQRVTDKLLTNYFFVGLLHILFPKAKFINTRRNPVDTCLSGFTKLFKDDMPHSYDLGELGRYYRQYDALMKHWEKVLPKGVMKVVNYEDVVADTDKYAREIIDFIGLEWDDACLEFHKSKRPVKTASVAQVRKPIYKTSVERWKKYGDGLQPLIDAING